MSETNNQTNSEQVSGLSSAALLAPYVYVVSTGDAQIAIAKDEKTNLTKVAIAALNAMHERSYTGQEFSIGELLSVQGGHLEEEHYLSTKRVFEAMGETHAAALLS